MVTRSHSRSAIEVLPLTPDRWPDFVRLFGERGACGGCWCMLWRLSAAEFNRMKGSGNKRAIHRIVTSGEIPGLIAYHDGQPVGWCSLGPRERFIRLENSRVLKRADDQPVWSVSCLFIDRKHRRQGISVKLLQGAVSFARKHKAQILEGYPTDSPNRTSPDAFVWTGLASAYRRAGFAEVLRRSPIRPIMRFNLTQRRRQPQHRSDIG